MSYPPNDEFIALAEKITTSGAAVKMTPKLLLAHFGVSQRRVNVNWSVDKALSDYKLKTEPDYKTAYLYGDILIKKDQNPKDPEDTIQRIKLLKAANTPPLSVSKSDSLQKAITLMMTKNFYQLLVMNAPTSQRVDGIITWQSIGWSLAKGNNPQLVKDCLTTEIAELHYETPILEAIHAISDKGVAYVRKHDNSISGFLTTTDIADELFARAEPYLLIGQIETGIRLLLDNKFTTEELNEIKSIGDGRPVESISGLTFNDYITLMRTKDYWERLNIPLDKGIFTSQLDEIRDIRNDVMHFSSDRLEADQEKALKNVAHFLKELLAR